MFRSSLIYLSKASWARRMVTQWQFARRAASRFIAGETLDDAIRVVRQLNQKGINATLDHLGEHTSNPEASRRATQDILEAMENLDTSQVACNISIKLTQIGLELDRELCAENLERILERAQKLGTFVRVDMEDSPWVDATLDLYRKMRFEAGYDNLGLVIQAYLFRSEQDVLILREQCTPIRLCKGAYKEPSAVAFPRKSDVDANYDRLTRMLLDGSKAHGCPAISENGKIPPPPALATHDERRIEYAKSYAREIGLPKNALEFQMLHGIRRELQERLAAEGYPVRVYVPYGTEWYPYFVRRLAERPANLWFFISNFVKK